MFRFLKRKVEDRRHEAEQAVADAHDNLKRIERRTPEVEEVVRKLKLIRERNHFAEQLELIMRHGHA